MTKKIKLFTAFAMAALLSAGTVYAQNARKFDSRPEDPAQNRQALGFRGHGFGQRGEDNLNDEIIIGKVKSINTSNSQITVTNTDGKDVTLEVNPFTRIVFREDFGPRQNADFPLPPVKGELKDLLKGDWVMISTFKTETKTLSAAKILSNKKLQTPADTANAK